MKHVTRIEAGGAVGMVHGDKKPTAKDREAMGRIVAAVAHSYTSNVCKNCKRRYRLRWTTADTGLCRRCG